MRKDYTPEETTQNLRFLAGYLSPAILAEDLGRWAGPDAMAEFVDEYAIYLGRDDLGGYGTVIGDRLVQSCDGLLDPEEVAAFGEDGPKFKDRDHLWAEFEELGDEMGFDVLIKELGEWIGAESLHAFTVKTMEAYEVKRG